MSKGPAGEPEPIDDGATTQAGSVYFKQPPTPRKRYTPRSRPTSEPVSTPKKSGNLANAIMLSNIRTFTIVALFMFGLLGLAFYLTGRIWQSREDRATAPITSPHDTAVAPAASRRPDRPRETGVVVQDVRAPAQPNVRTELDTDAMRRAVAMQRRADGLVAAGNRREAIERYQDALQIWPYLTTVWAQLGRVYLESRDYSRAQTSLERAVESDPANPELLNDLGVALLYQNRIDRAIEVFETVLDLTPGYAPALFNQALGYLAKDDNESGARLLDQYLRNKPYDARALKERAYLFASAERYLEALEHLNRAMVSAPDWAPLYFDAAATTALLGRIDDAVRYLDKAEGLTDPHTVYQVYQQPAFREIRLTEPGRVFETHLADRARELMSAAEAPQELPLVVTEPMTSTPVLLER